MQISAALPSPGPTGRSKAQVSAFAARAGLQPGIVVGMFQHCGVLRWNRLHGLKQKVYPMGRAARPDSSGKVAGAAPEP